MKKFLIRTFLLFSIIFVFMFCITMFLEYKNKEKINEPVKVEYEIEEGKIENVSEPLKVEANYEFAKVYYYISLIITLASPIVFYYFGGISLVRGANIHKKILEGIYICLLYGVFSEVLMFPKILFSSFYRLRLVGLSSQSFGSFMIDYAKGDLENLFFVLPIAVLIYVIYMKKENWYIYVAIILIAVSLGSNYIYPYIDEIKNDLMDMEDGQLKDKILELANRAGIENLEIKVIPKAYKTSSMNAYMTGIHNSRRIVFWDTTLDKLSEKEVLSVAAHEMGHYKLNHIQKSMAMSILVTIISLMCIHAIMYRAGGKDYRSLENICKVIFVINIISLLTSPIECAYSRRMEVQADEFAMESTKDTLTNGLLELRFVESNLTPMDVGGLYKMMVYDHPTVRERIENSNNYKLKNN